MNYLNPGISTVYLIGALSLIALSWYLYSEVGTERGSEYIVATILIGAIGWGLFAVKTVMTGIPEQKFILAMGGLTLILSAVFVFVFASIYTGDRFHESLHSRLYIGALIGSYVAVTIVDSATSADLLYGKAVTQAYAGYTYTSFEELAILSVTAFGAYVLLGYGTLSLFRYWDNATGSERTTQLVIAGVLIAVFANLMSISLDESVLAALPWSSTGMLTFGILTTFAVKNGMLDVESVTGPVFDNTSEQVFVLNSNKEIVDYNAAVKQTYSSVLHQDYINNPIAQHPMFDEDTITEIFEDRDDAGRFSIVVGDQKHWYLPDLTPIEFSGNRDGYLLILREVTDEVEYVKKVEQRKRDLEQFSSAITHDIRNPLNVVTANLGLAKDHLDSGEHDEAFTRVDKAADATNRVEQIITDMYEIIQEKNTDITVSPTPVKKVVTRALSTSNLQDSLTVDVSNAQIEADKNKLQTVFENLLKNSDAHGGDNITIYTENTHGELGKVVYEDDGPGIDEEIADDIFEYGYSDGGSSGYGMSIIQAVVESHGWEIEVDTSHDTGARFVITGVKILQKTPEQSSTSKRAIN
ncbi:sensor histidine kinase [Salinibaculum rarum]|uniref:sensor histidine kinase n=1 Tax=Salinibaculum rarum TaxID=3058903 RepID=UPI00265FE249|nr:sensor histidine kinase [Salinibaculum sp. KK48]